MVVGAVSLPALGFGIGGITSGSIVAGLQGPAVVAGSCLRFFNLSVQQGWEYCFSVA
jgi:hypothetical protein